MANASAMNLPDTELRLKALTPQGPLTDPETLEVLRNTQLHQAI